MSTANRPASDQDGNQWEVGFLRATTFIPDLTSEGSVGNTWWEKVAAGKPEDERISHQRGTKEQEGMLNGNNLAMVSQPGRVDLALGAAGEESPEQSKLPSLGPMSADTLEPFMNIVKRWGDYRDCYTLNINFAQQNMVRQTTKTKGGPDKPGRKDPSLAEIFDMFPDEQAAMEWLERNVWPDGRVCPRCANKYTCTSKHPNMPYYCSECKKRFSVRINTIMESSNIRYRDWAVTTYLMATRPKGISSVQLAKDLGISQSAAWFLLHRLRESWRSLAGPDLAMAGPVEVDEVYLGGREKNKHADKKGRTKKTAVVVGIKDRETGAIRAVPVPETTGARLVGFVESNITKGARVFTDENRAYNDLENHHTVNHGDGEYVRGEVVHINGMESFWAPVRRGYNGTFHHIDPKHLHRYVNEFSGRLSDKAVGVIERMGEIVRNLVGKRLTYGQQLVAGNALCGRL